MNADHQMDDLMQMAREAGLVEMDHDCIEGVPLEKLPAFAQLVAKKAVEAERERLLSYDKTDMNCFVETLYDQKMREGKHGHYETMFHVVHRAAARLIL